MSRRKQKAPLQDLGALLERAVKVTVEGVTRRMHPNQATLEKCAEKALKGDIRACGKFIRLCLRHGLLVKPELVDDDHQQRLQIPKDWDEEEFMAMFYRFGFPPWSGPRDGLTAAEREQRRALPKGRHR